MWGSRVLSSAELLIYCGAIEFSTFLFSVLFDSPWRRDGSESQRLSNRMAVGCETWMHMVLSWPLIHEEGLGVVLRGIATCCRWAGTTGFPSAAPMWGFNLMQDHSVQRSPSWMRSECAGSSRRWIPPWRRFNTGIVRVLMAEKVSFWKKKSDWVEEVLQVSPGCFEIGVQGNQHGSGYQQGGMDPYGPADFFLFFLVLFDLIHCAALIAVKWSN